jgi:GntR family transcriptional regulator
MPPYLQLAAILRAQIQSGQLPPGTRLPSVLALAGQYQVAQVTVQKALSILKAEGLIVAYTGYGTFVSEDQPGQ